MNWTCTVQALRKCRLFHRIWKTLSNYTEPHVISTHLISTRHFENSRNIHKHQIRHPLLSNKNWQYSRSTNFENQGGHKFQGKLLIKLLRSIGMGVLCCWCVGSSGQLKWNAGLEFLLFIVVIVQTWLKGLCDSYNFNNY